MNNKSFTWKKEGDDSCLWFIGTLDLQNDPETNNIAIVFSCLQKNETDPSATAPDTGAWEDEDSDAFASFTQNSITFYATEFIPQPTEGETPASTEKVRQELTPNITFQKSTD